MFDFSGSEIYILFGTEGVPHLWFGSGTRWNLMVVLDYPDGNQDGVGRGVGVCWSNHM